ncbi:hypothetical protein UlMin_004532 [Ulmus minor]
MASLVVCENSSAVQHAEALQKACKGWGADEKAIIKILGHRNAAQKRQIRQAYEQLYQEDLVKRLESELSGDLERAMYRWILDPEDQDGVLANLALKKIKKEYGVIIEIACVLSAEQLLGVRRAYQCRYKRSLEEDVAANTTANMRKLLVSLVSTYRYEGNEVNTTLAKMEADILYGALKANSINYEEIIRILTTRSKAQLMATFNRYRDDHCSSLTKSLRNTDDEFQKALRTTIRCIKDPRKYFEKVLRNAMKGMGTDEDTLTRVIVSRAETDLNEIKELYYKRNSVCLDHAVTKETSGHYKAFLLTPMGKD